MSLAWDIHHDEDWSYSNNDATATHPSGNSQQYLKVNEGVKLTSARGTAHYVELHMTGGNYSGSAQILGYNQDATPQQDISVGVPNTWYMFWDPTSTSDAGFQWQGASTIDRVHFRGVPWTSAPGVADGDVLSVLVDFADYGSPCEYFVYAWFNGTPIGSGVACGFSNWSDYELYLGFRFQDSNGLQVTLVDDPDQWAYDPTVVWPWAQALSSTIQTPATPYNGYAKVRTGTGAGFIPLSISSWLRVFLDEINKVELLPPTSSSDDVYADMWPPRAYGKYYLEAEIESVPTPVGPVAVGLHQCEANVQGGGSDIRRMMYMFGTDYDEWWFSGGDTTESANIGAIGEGDVIMMAFDLPYDVDEQDGAAASTKAWVGINGTWMNGDPSTNTDGKTLNTRFDGGAYIPRLHAGASAGQGTFRGIFNGGHKEFHYSVPTGFEAWSAGS